VYVSQDGEEAVMIEFKAALDIEQTKFIASILNTAFDKNGLLRKAKTVRGGFLYI
jgi:hypothetical protein